MKSSSTIPFSKNWYDELTWFQTFFFIFLLTIFSSTSVSSSTISYTDHCGSFVAEVPPTDLDHITYAHLPAETSHYSGGDKILGKNSSESSFYYYDTNSLSFRTTRNVYKTSTSGVYKIEAYLTFPHSNSYHLSTDPYYGRSYYSRNFPPKSSLRFVLNGFWSESSGMLCMVGSGSWYSKESNILNLDAVLILKYAKNSTLFTSFVTGILKSLSSSSDQSYFEPISIWAFPPMTPYKYTLVSEDFNKGCSGGIDIPPNSSISLHPRSICSMLSWRFNIFKLDYASKCSNSAKNCTPFGSGIGYTPPFMSLYTIQCAEEEKKLRYLIQFPNSSYIRYQQFDPNTILIGEGSWDWNKNRLCMVACRVLNPNEALEKARLGDCSIRLSLRFPAVWSIRSSIRIKGQIWTTKTANELGYFDRITFQSYDEYYSVMAVPDVKYEYTELDRVRGLCPPASKDAKNKGESYPNGYSHDMRFDLSFKSSERNYTWGSAVPISVGNRFYECSCMIISNSGQQFYELEEERVTETSSAGPLKISYKISLHGVKLGGAISSLNTSWSSNHRVEIFAEGFYDNETGNLCMVGCRNAGISMDCEILVKFQFPQVSGRHRGFIKGSIESTRNKNDTLYFEHLNLTANAYYGVEGRRSTFRMDLEITMVLISNTLACVFLVLQIFYVKKHPNTVPFLSIVMLVILTVGHMIPLVLNLEALFLESLNQRSVMLRSGGWVEINEVIVRVVTMVAFLWQFRLLHLAWTARLRAENVKGVWVAEKKVLFVCSPLYIIGGSIALFVNWKKKNLWGDLRSYAGLVLDGFLFPQILFNVFQNSRESALSGSFYVGNTFVRLLPHAYDLYRAHNYVQQQFNGSYIYANPSADFYSAAWDVIIPCGGVVLAVIIYLQQRFGGRCVLPRRFKEVEVYEKVPVVDGE